MTRKNRFKQTQTSYRLSHFNPVFCSHAFSSFKYLAWSSKYELQTQSVPHSFPQPTHNLISNCCTYTQSSTIFTYIHILLASPALAAAAVVVVVLMVTIISNYVYHLMVVPRQPQNKLVLRYFEIAKLATKRATFQYCALKQACSYARGAHKLAAPRNFRVP